MEGSRYNNGAADTRALSETLSVVLLLGIVMVGVIPVVVLGTATIDASMHSAELSNGEMAMHQFTDRAGIVASGKSDTQSVTVPLGRGRPSLQADDDAGRMTVTVIDLDTGNETVVVNETMGAVVFSHYDDHGEIDVAYQAGGLFKKEHEGVRMLSPPDVRFRDGSLSIPITHVTTTGQLNDDVRISRDGELERVFPTDSMGNPIQNAKITIQIESEYGPAWADYLESKFGEASTVTNESTSVTTVTVELRNQDQWRDDLVVEHAIASNAGTEQVDIDKASYIDSYDSDEGAYAEQSPGRNASVHVANGVELDDGGTIYGDLNSGGGTVALREDDTRVSGMVRYGGSLGDMEGVVGSGPFANGTTPTIATVDTSIVERVDELEAANGETTLAETSTTQLGAGEYYFEELFLEQTGELVLDTTDGDIVIGVRNRVRVEETAEIRVVGDGNVTFYQDGGDFEFHDASLSVPGDEAARVVLFGTSETKVEFDNNSRFVGVICTAGDSQLADDRVRIRDGSHVYGAIIGDVKEIRGSSSLHFDEALLGKTLLEIRPETSDVPAIDYLYVTVRPVAVE